MTRSQVIKCCMFHALKLEHLDSNRHVINAGCCVWSEAWPILGAVRSKCLNTNCALDGEYGNTKLQYKVWIGMDASLHFFGWPCILCNLEGLAAMKYSVLSCLIAGLLLSSYLKFRSRMQTAFKYHSVNMYEIFK